MQRPSFILASLNRNKEALTLSTITWDRLNGILDVPEGHSNAYLTSLDAIKWFSFYTDNTGWDLVQYSYKLTDVEEIYAQNDFATLEITLVLKQNDTY